MIQEAIQNLTHNRTTVVIAHRLSTIRDVDTIYVLSSGELVESGTHDELLTLRGVYSELHRLQSEGIEPTGSIPDLPAPANA